MSTAEPAGTTASYYGDRVRVACGATGRYLTRGWALVVSVQDNDLFMDRVNSGGEAPHATLPVPTDRELSAAMAAMRAAT